MNHHQQSFITEYLRHRSPFTAYCLAYNLKDCSNYDSIMSAADKLLNDDAVGGTIRSILDNIRHEVEQEVRAELRQELLTIQRKRELLASIATGEMVAVKLYKGKDCNVCTQMVRPTISNMLRAIDLDSKLAGHYPVHNRQSTGQQLKVEQSTKSEHVSRPESIRERGNTTNSAITDNVSSPPLADYGHTIAAENPKKNTPVGNNGVALNETNKNYHQRIKTQQNENEAPLHILQSDGNNNNSQQNSTPHPQNLLLTATKSRKTLPDERHEIEFG